MNNFLIIFAKKIKMEKILAKSNGQTLKEHSLLVSKIAVKIAEKTLSYKDDELIDVIRLSGLLHDIGKCTEEFQKKLKKNINSSEDIVEAKLKKRHNEVGWAFLSRYLNLPPNKLKKIVEVVYWHHGISGKMSSYKDTDIDISTKDLSVMIDYLKSVIDESLVYEKPFKPKLSPNFYYYNEENADELNMYNLFIRSCLIPADRIASINPNISDIEIDKMLEVTSIPSCKNNISNHNYYGNHRFNLQLDIVKKISKITQINAPAGFGKTILGLLWAFINNKKIIWVCPRNIVAESVYRSINEELKAFGIDFLSIELFLSGEVKKKNDLFKSDFSSDIIVTNIDNFLAPSVDSSHADRLFTIINSDVIFDEFHELLSEQALFSCFINIVNTRNKLTNSNTVLLSATGIDLSMFWDSFTSKTLFLPAKNKHYPSAHNKKYKLNCYNQIDIEKNFDSSLFIFNSIKEAQIHKDKFNAELLIHSGFDEIDFSNNCAKMYEYYGKNSVRNKIKQNLIGTRVIQASLDISLKHFHESVLSPQSTGQGAGRCDRFGDYDEQCSINVYNIQSVGENTVRDMFYSKNLSNAWFEFLSKYSGTEITNDELYNIINSFETKYSETLNRFYRTKYDNSLQLLSEVYPVKFFSKKIDDIVSAGANKLRSNGLEIFYICKYYNSNKFTNPFNVKINKSFGDDFKENSLTYNRITKTMKSLRDEDDRRFDYNEILNNKKYINITDAIRLAAKKSNTPYIRFDKVYHTEYGVISPEILEQILINKKI